MPRIEPIKLLKCLSGCLSPNGGIKSRDNVETLVKLMTKYSKKLVSKCIYIQVLKYTETDLLGLFMGSGGWCTIHMWLTESIAAKNWPLVRELLELLLLCPVNIERLKTNNCPKLVKELSKDGNDLAIRALASKLVEQWLKTVKGGENVAPINISEIPQIVANASLQFIDSCGIKNENIEEEVNNAEMINNQVAGTHPEDIKMENEKKYMKNDDDEIDSKARYDEVKEDGKKESLPVLKITVKDGKQIISKVNDSEKKHNSKSKHKDRSEKSSSNTKSSSSSSSSSKHSSRSSDKHRSSSKSSSHRSRSPSKHRSKDSDKDKNRDKDKHGSSSKHKHSDSKKSSSKSSSSCKDDKKKSTDPKPKKEEKPKVESGSQNNKSDAEKSGPPSIHKLGRIPKIDESKKEKHSISIEVRKPDEPKPKTVKTFHSKFRKHGLEEEIKPPPSRAAVLNKKVTPVVPPTVSLPKRPSPIHNETPPEKKIKIIEPIEKPGSIKLIPPKPKPMLLQESDMFMDALNASATNKKEPKKRKRRISSSKDGNPSDSSPPTTPTGVTSPRAEPKLAPLRFYQDTLDADDDKDKSADKESDKNESVEDKSPPRSPTKDADHQDEPHTLTIDGLKGVLCYHKRKGPKKSIRWKPDTELEEIQYFELDETERVNVTKTFTDMKYLERIHERDAFQKGRNLANDDVMEEKTLWRALIPIDVEGQIYVEYGKNSKEKEIQAVRQKGTLQPLYFHKSMIPDSPLEPDVETHTYSEPVTIPLEDVTGNQDNISDFRNMPWPEPKGTAPATSTNLGVPTLFPQNIPQFPNNFGTPQFPMVPGFQGPTIPGDWSNSVPQMLPNGIAPGPLPPGMMPPGGIAPGLMVPPENMLMGPGGPDMFNGPNPMFGPGMPEGFNIMDNMNGITMPPANMFPSEFNLQGGQMANGNDMFPGPGNFHGTMRGRGSGHWRGKGPGNWDGPPRGRGAHSRGGNNSRKAVCIYFQRKGSCRQGDKCTFLHPGVNCPF